MFLETFKPANQNVYCKPSTLSRLFIGSAPRLNVVTRTYGEDITDLWLAGQLRDLANISGVKEKLRQEHYDSLVSSIKAMYGGLKVTELMYFFFLFKGGEYGHFYGSLDCMTIMERLKSFVADRDEIIYRIRKEEEKKQKAEDDLRRAAEVKAFREALAVSNMSIAEYLAISHNNLTLEELAEIGWMFRLSGDNKSNDEQIINAIKGLCNRTTENF